MDRFVVTIDDRPFEVTVEPVAGDLHALQVMVDGVPVRVDLPDGGDAAMRPDWIIVDDRPVHYRIDRESRRIEGQYGVHWLDVRDMEAGVARPRSGDGRVKAPIPGLVTRLLAEVGATVNVGQPLLILEAMKMENEIRATRSGTLAAIHVLPGQAVLRDAVLAEIV